MGNLVFQATLGGQVNLVGPNTASTFNINVPTVNGNMVTTGDTGTVTNTMCATSVYTAPGTIGSGTPNTGAFTTLSASSTTTLSSGTANGIAYLNGSKVVTTGSAITFDGTNFATTGTASATKLIPTGGSATGTGLYLPAANTLAWSNNGSETMRLDSSGNLGLGVTPSAWGGSYKALQFSSGCVASYSNSQMTIGQNFYDDGAGSYKYVNTAAATRYLQSGLHYWYVAPSGTAGTAITWTQAMTLDASGNLGIGTTSPASKLQINDATSARIDLVNTNGTTGRMSAINGTFYVGTTTSHPIAFITADTERARIDSSGNLLVGTTDTNDNSGNGLKVRNSGQTVCCTASYSTNANSSYIMYSTGAGAYRFYVQWNGQVNATSTSITAISDQRLKENVRDIDTGLDSIMALKPRRFDWKEGKGQDKKNVAGFIAQEFETVFPESVSTSMAGADGIEYKNINHETLIPTLVKAIQEQQAIITQLQADVAALKGQA